MSDSAVSPEIFFSKYGDKEKDQILVQSVVHTAELPRPTLWPKLVKALDFWFKTPKAKLEKINNIIQIIQVCNNVLDDVSENALFRKGAPTANSVYGNAEALNAAYYCSFISLEKIRDFGAFEAIKLVNEYFLNLSRGQGTEVYWRDNLICPTEEEYLKMIDRKSGSLILFTIQLMQMSGGNKSDFTKLAEILGKFFHIYDDYINLHDEDEYMLNKYGCDSLKEGKYSFPVIHAIHAEPEDVQMKNIVRQRATDPEVSKYCLTLLEKFGSLEYTKQTLQDLRAEAEREIAKIEENPYMAQLFDQVFNKLKIN